MNESMILLGNSVHGFVATGSKQATVDVRISARRDYQNDTYLVHVSYADTVWKHVMHKGPRVAAIARVFRYVRYSYVEGYVFRATTSNPVDTPKKKEKRGKERKRYCAVPGSRPRPGRAFTQAGSSTVSTVPLLCMEHTYSQSSYPAASFVSLPLLLSSATLAVAYFCASCERYTLTHTAGTPRLPNVLVTYVFSRVSGGRSCGMHKSANGCVGWIR